MTNQLRNQLLNNSNIYADVLTDWCVEDNYNCKFLPDQMVRVRPSRARKCDKGYYRKYASMRGVVVAASTPNGITMHSTEYPVRGYTRYYVAFPELNNKVIGLQSNYLAAI